LSGGGADTDPRLFLDTKWLSGFTKAVNIILFGYPRTGKTTLFNLLTGAGREVKAYEDGQKEPTVRTCALPDPRLDGLAALHPDKKKVAAPLDMTDLVGISYGEVKGSAYLSHLHKADGLVHVVRGFRDDRIPHPKGKIGPAYDIRFMEEELVLSDLVMVNARIEKLEKDLKKMKSPDGEKEKEVLERLRPFLEEGKRVHDFPLSPAEEKSLRSFAFLTQKPLLNMINLDEADAARLEVPEQIFGPELAAVPILAFCGRIESEILELGDEEKALFMSSYGIKEPSAARFFRQVPRFLDVLTFYTIGKEEVRAWTMRRGSTAVKAAGAIHSDIEKGFIRAEVVPCEEILRLGQLQKAKDAGAIRLEGKDYVVQDGDVIYFRFAQ
jgi:GTP-binding protein YchF